MDSCKGSIICDSYHQCKFCLNQESPLWHIMINERVQSTKNQQHWLWLIAAHNKSLLMLTQKIVFNYVSSTAEKLVCPVWRVVLFGYECKKWLMICVCQGIASLSQLFFSSYFCCFFSFFQTGSVFLISNYIQFSLSLCHAMHAEWPTAFINNCFLRLCQLTVS